MQALTLLMALLAPLGGHTSTKNILVTGYWPPTNEMLRELSPKDPAKWQGKNWHGTGYDVYAYFPENTEKDGVGEGDFRVDFASVFNDFMKRTEELKPIAILSFGHGDGPWEIETIFPAYFKDWYRSGSIPSSVGVLPAFPIPPSLGDDVPRKSSLPREAIRRAVAKLGDKGLRPWIDQTGGAGDFVCGFTGYLESWYHDQHRNPSDPAFNKAAGFIHVDGDLEHSKASMEMSLSAIIENL